MKTLLLTPPQWHPINPHLAVPLLSGQLNANGFSCVGRDLNVEFYDEILRSSFVEKSVAKIKSLFVELTDFFENNNYNESEIDNYTIDIKSRIIKFRTIKAYIETKSDKFEKTIQNIDDAVSVLRTERFYEAFEFVRALKTVQDALDIVLLPYAPAQMTMANYKNPLFTVTYESLMYQNYSREENIFIDFFENKLDELNLEQYDMIGVSIPSKQQLMPGLTLVRMLRERTKAHITVGGFFSSIIKEDKKNIRKVFEICDSLAYGEGERSIVELARYVNGEIPIEEVSNIGYVNADGEVVFNPYVAVTDLDNIAPACYDGYDLKKYFTPDNALLYQTSKGCFWGKCSFCDFYFGKPNFHLKSVSKAVDEIEMLVEKYGVRKFIATDEHIHPSYAEKFAREILKRNLKIEYYSFARFDKGFTRELFDELYRSGCRRLDYGYESANERVVTLMNKGVDFNSRDKILQDAADAGIWNHLCCVMGFPSETREEAMQTIETVCNTDYMDSFVSTLFYLKKNALIMKNPDKYHIRSMTDNQELESLVSFEDYVMTDAEKRKMNDYFLRYHYEVTQGNAFPTLEAGIDYLFLYICRYGRKGLKNIMWGRYR